MKISKEFIKRHSAIMKTYGEKYHKLDEELASEITKIERAESCRLAEAAEPEHPIGTRTWCSSYKRPGTIIAAKIKVSTKSNDYYAPNHGLESYIYNMDDPWDQRDCAYWEYTVKTDPSPKRGYFHEFNTTDPALLGDDGKSARPRAPWSDDLAELDDALDGNLAELDDALDGVAVMWAVQKNFGV